MSFATILRERSVDSLITPLLALVTVGVYGLVLSGATASVLDAGGSCAAWPACTGSPMQGLTDIGFFVAVLHRVTTLVVGMLLLGVTLAVWRAEVPRLVQGLVFGAAALYPMQVAIGAFTAVTGGGFWLSVGHLVVGLLIFGAILVALLRWLEISTSHVTSSFDDASQPSSATEVPAQPNPNRTGIAWLVWRARAYLELTKPRLMWLLCFVALAGIGLAGATTGATITWHTIGATMLGGVLAIGASGTFNHVIERDVDQHMERTADRPLATDAIPAWRAVTFGVVLMIASLAVFRFALNPLAAVLGLLAIGFYSVVYTVILKPNTSQNIVIGGAVGALPALIGWAAVTESIGVPAIILGLVIFLWTPAHFYNLALVYKEDYARGGFPMLPIVRGERVTRRHIGYYFGATLGSLTLLGATAGLGALFVLTSVLMSGIFVAALVHLYRQQTPSAAMRTFHASNAFLGAVMVVIVVETLMLA